jgi:hypothetical protein
MAAPEPRKSPRIQKSQAALLEVKKAQEADKARVAADLFTRIVSIPSQFEYDDEKLTEAQQEVYNAKLIVYNKSWANFLKKRKQQSTARDAIFELFTIGATDLALLMFGPFRVARWEALFPADKVRGIFEIADVDAQCNQTILEVKVGETPCWICGMPIWSLSADLPETWKNGHSPECEHVLPVAQAAIFLQLYDRVNSSSKLFELEYAWSHKTCNQTKNSDVYFKTKNDQAVMGPNELPILDEAKYRALLEKIYSSERTDADIRNPRPGIAWVQEGTTVENFAEQVNPSSFVHTLQNWVHVKYSREAKSVEQWKNDRVIEFKKKYQAILNFIGGHAYRMSPELYLLSLAAAPAQIISRQNNHRMKGTRNRIETLHGKFAPTIPPPDSGFVAPVGDPDWIPLSVPFDPKVYGLEEDDLLARDLLQQVGKEMTADEEATEAASILAGPLMMEVESKSFDDVLKLFHKYGAVGIVEAANSAAEDEEDMDNPSNAAAAPAAGPAVGEKKRRRIMGGRTRRRTRSFLPHNRRRSHHAIKMSSKRHSP